MENKSNYEDTARWVQPYPPEYQQALQNVKKQCENGKKYGLKPCRDTKDPGINLIDSFVCDCY